VTDHDAPYGPEDAALRALLEDAVSDVEPEPALHEIQNRTSQKVVPMSSKRPWMYAVVGAVVATAATVLAVTVIADDDPARTSGPAGSPSASSAPGDPSATSEPSTPPSDGPSDQPSEGVAQPTTSVPVYYVGDTPAGTRLFREFHQLAGSPNPAHEVESALKEAVRDSALDPDYRSDWPEGTGIAGVTVDGSSSSGAVTVNLVGAGLHDRPEGLSEEQAQMAVEQLVYTAQAVLQERRPVQLLLDDHQTDTVLGVPTSEPLAEGDPMSVQGTVWVISPQDGDTVGTTFTVEGRGAFFEATVSWQLLQGDKVVKHGFATAAEGMTLSPYSFKVTAKPGDYVLRVYEADMSGGEGNGEAEDTKQITVE
jgi:hypothetical protein